MARVCRDLCRKDPPPSSLEELWEGLKDGSVKMPCGERCRPECYSLARLDGWVKVRCPDHAVFLLRIGEKPGEIEVDSPPELQVILK